MIFKTLKSEWNFVAISMHKEYYHLSLKEREDIDMLRRNGHFTLQIVQALPPPPSPSLEQTIRKPD